jgi:hypothetical protein
MMGLSRCLYLEWLPALRLLRERPVQRGTTQDHSDAGVCMVACKIKRLTSVGTAREKGTSLGHSREGIGP